MGLQNKIHSIIVLSTAADLTAHTYTQVYAGAAGTPVINGTSVTMAAGSTIDILVKSITGAAGIYLLGSPINTTTGSPDAGGRPPLML